jgi:hypothetical protein
MNNFDAIVMSAMEIAHTSAVERENPELSEFHLLYRLISNPNNWLSRR